MKSTVLTKKLLRSTQYSVYTPGLELGYL